MHITYETCQVWALRIGVCNCHLGGGGVGGIEGGTSAYTLQS